MKTTYLINQVQPDGSTRLSAVSADEWRSAIRENEGLSPERQRYFIRDYIADGNEMDCMVIEVSASEYIQWDKDRSAARRNREAGKNFHVSSLDAPLAGMDRTMARLEQLPDQTQLESMVCDSVLMEELKEALAAWRPWATDLLKLYLNGQKRACTEVLSRKYGVSPQVIRKYKRQFEEFVKKFLGGVSL